MKNLIPFLFLIVSVSCSFAQADDPCSATPLTVNTSCINTSGTNVGATGTLGVPAPGCGSYMGYDVWYSITPATSGTVIISTTAGTLTDGAMAIYSGPNCSTLSLMACDDDNGTGLMPQLIVTVTAGSTYWIRFWEFGGDVFGNFQICAKQYTGSVNQDCVTATQICSTASLFDNSPNSGAVSDLNASNRGCLLYNEHQVQWYYFQITTSGTFIFTITPVIATTDYDFAVWGPGSTCPPTALPTRCSSAGATGATGLNFTATDFTEGPGTGDKYVQYLNCLAGETYIICIDNWTQNYQGFTLTFGGTANIDCTPLVLPVTLIGFEGHTAGIKNDLTWTTSAEINSAAFTIESSENMQNFSAIGNIPAAGNSSSPMYYQFTDDHPFSNTYYRLKQTDGNGQFFYSDIISVENRRAGNFSIYPNPAINGEIHIRYAESIAENAFIEVMNAYGSVISTHPFTGAVTDIQLPSKGMYWVVLHMGNTVISEKVIY